MRRFIFLATILALTISFHAFPPSLQAVGPWKGQVVDGETKQPLQGVIVLAQWYRYWPDFDGFPAYGYVASEQLITDENGRFSIKAPSFTASDPSVLEEPEIRFSKPGYEWRRLEGEESLSRLDVCERKLQDEKAGRQFDDKSALIELLPQRKAGNS